MRRLAAVALVVACGGHKPVETEPGPAFDCRNRSASFVATGHISGDELGVQIDCAQVGPRIKRWRSDKAGTRQDDAHGLTPAQFDQVWSEIDATGWPYLKNCTNGSGNKRDPVWVFDVKDDQNKATFECQARVAPAPYNAIVDPLDLLAN